MFKKFLIFVLTFITLNWLFSVPVRAEGEFITDAIVEYRVQDSGKTQVVHTFTIENVFSTLYATTYTLTLDNINVVNPTAYEGTRQLTLTSKKDGDTTALSVNLDVPVVGKGKSQTFSISFEDDSLAVRTGEVWEIAVPKLGNQNPFRNYSVVLSVPSSFGQEAYISPTPQKRGSLGDRLLYYFGKSDVEKVGITAGFGQFQVFSFSLNYHLENPLTKKASIDVAIPPDTAMQKMYYQTISPSPYNVSVDDDGNWLATFLLSPRQKVNIEAKGFVQIFAGPRPYPKPSPQTLTNNLQPTNFWQSNDPQIRDLAKSLGNSRSIYDYVTKNLTYDYSRVSPNVTRLGAKGALASPSNAICMEYTDLFIALNRAIGVPTREIEGYAYSENPKVQPLSLVADVLHSWPEYWDSQKGTWIPIDPTWGSTTGGVDFFTKLDLRHFTFVIHGKDDQKPYPPGSYKLGTNPQKDVFVSFGQLPQMRQSTVSIDYVSESSLPFAPTTLLVRIKNNGPQALSNLTPTVLFDDKQVSKFNIEVLPPYGTYEFPVSLPFSFLGREMPDNIVIVAANQRLLIPTSKNTTIIYNLVTVFVALFLILFLVLIKLKKIDPIRWILVLTKRK